MQNYIHNKPLTNKTVIRQWDGVIDDTSIVYEGACWFAGSQNWNLSELVGGNMTFVDYTGKKYVKMIAYIRDIEFESIIPNPDLVYLVDMGYSLGEGLL